MNKMKRMLRGTVRWFGFSYRIAWTITLLLSIGTAALAFTMDGTWASLMCSVSAGFFTGFVIFFISGLKNYDERYCNDTVTLCKNGFDVFESVSPTLVCLTKYDKPILLKTFLNLYYDLKEGYSLYYSAVIHNCEDRQERKRYKKNAQSLETIIEKLTNIVEDIEPLQEEISDKKELLPILKETYKLIYSMKTDLSCMEYSANLKLAELKRTLF